MVSGRELSCLLFTQVKCGESIRDGEERERERKDDEESME